MQNQFQRTFVKLNEVKRRNPNHYIRNPTKVHFHTLGSRDYIFEDKPKGNNIRANSNIMRKTRYDYKSLLPAAPKMSFDGNSGFNPNMTLSPSALARRRPSNL